MEVQQSSLVFIHLGSASRPNARKGLNMSRRLRKSPFIFSNFHIEREVRRKHFLQIMKFWKIGYKDIFSAYGSYN